MASYLAYLSVREDHNINYPRGKNWKAARKKRLSPKLQFDATVAVDEGHDRARIGLPKARYNMSAGASVAAPVYDFRGVSSMKVALRPARTTMAHSARV